MNVTPLNFEDLEELKQIYEKHFAHEFDFPDFQKFICAFKVTDNGKIITAGGIRTIAESIIITDKECSIRERREALFHMLHASAYLAQQVGFDQLHAFIQDEKWLTHLKRHGFKDCIGKALYLPLS